MSIHELEKESQERLNNAYKALNLPDPEGYTGTVEREYQKELARNLQKEGSKAANASTDQRIAGKLKVAGYSLYEIQNVIEQHSPMAVKPSQEQRQAYAKAVIQKAYFPGGTEPEKRLEERRLDLLGIETKVEPVIESNLDTSDEDSELFPLDILVDRNLSHDEIVAACVDIFSLSPTEILITEDITDLDIDLDENILLICELMPIGGDFKTFLSFYPQNFSIEEQLEEIGDGLTIARKFCEFLNVKSLIKDDSSPDEYEEDAYFLIDRINIQRVYIDLDKIDDDLYLLK